MARADFYILSGKASAPRIACSVTNKAWQQGNRIYMLAPSQEDAEHLDELLWTFQDISFVPHALVDGPSQSVPVILGWPGTTAPEGDVLVNLTATVPDIAPAYQRVVEIVAADPEHKQLGRDRYRQYREMGYELHNHEIDGEQGG